MTDTERVVELMALIDPDRVANAQDVVLALDAAFAEVRLDERRAIVAWLQSWEGAGHFAGRVGVLIAERIERGEHLGEATS